MTFDSLPPEALPIAMAAIFGAALLALIFSVLAYAAARRAASRLALTRDDMSVLLREEGDFLRDVVENSARGLRQEMGTALMQATVAHQGLVQGLSDSLLQRTDAFGQRLDRMAATADDRHAALRTMTETRFDQFVAAEAETARDLRAELNGSFQRMRQGVSETLDQASAQQKERLEATQRDLKALAEAQTVAGETLRRTVESRLDLLRQENTLELEKMRATVDEKLQTTLEQRLNESFSRVVEELNKAYTVFGEMKAISSHVGDLKNVLTNPKLRGTFGEVQLAMLLQDFLPPSQYIENAQVREHSGERVEFAIRLPMAEGGEMLLPVDAKFPREDHEHMIAALEAGDLLLAERFRKQLEARIKSFAKDISRKYINPPQTTERAILFLPTESLFAEVLRMPGLFDHVQRECNVMLAGPTTFAAILHAFQVNHRSMAIAERSSEVWKTLAAVRREFGKYNETVSKVARQLNTASRSVEELGTRTRAMDRALKTVATLPGDDSTAKVLEFGVSDDGVRLSPEDNDEGLESADRSFVRAAE